MVLWGLAASAVLSDFQNKNVLIYNIYKSNKNVLTTIIIVPLPCERIFKGILGEGRNKNKTTMISYNGSLQKILSFVIILTLLFFSGFVSYAQVAINKTGAPPDPSSILDISATDGGLLIPRMTTAQINQIINPAQGLMVYNNTLSAIQILDQNSAWTTVADLNDLSWTVVGDNQYSNVSGNVGIGTVVPNAKLEVHDTAPVYGDYIFQVTSMNNDYVFTVQHNGTVGIGTDNPASLFQINANSSTPVPFQIMSSDNTYVIRVQDDGAIGIAIDHPEALLDIKDNAAYDYPLQVRKSDGSYVLRIQDDGAIGVGEDNPNSLLDIRGNTSKSIDYELRVRDASGNPHLVVDNSGNVSIGSGSPNPAAVMEISSDVKGFLLPRLNDSAIANLTNPPEGLLLYNKNTKEMVFYDGSEWVAMGAGGKDTDQDGIKNGVDIDDDNDGILDVDEGNGGVDTDGDGVPDSIDSDSDNDGVPDQIEGNDANHDGVADSTPSGNDADHDGLDDVFDTDNGGTPAGLQDTDADGIPDWKDTDDDGDGLLTDGTDTSTTGEGTGDEDGDGIPNYLDGMGISQIECSVSRIYQEVSSNATSKIWLDKNLGADHVATAPDDYQAYGSLYQWGRLNDDHQCITHTSSTAATADSDTTHTLSHTDTPVDNQFIVGAADWRSPRNDNLWQGVNGINNPCPSGYRVPTETEWNNERLSWSSSDAAGAYASPLKLTLAGDRLWSNGHIQSLGSYAYYWSSTTTGDQSRRLGFSNSGSGMYKQDRAFGFSVRCIKD